MLGRLVKIFPGKQPAFAGLAPPVIQGQIADDPVKIAGRVLQKLLAEGPVKAQPGFLHQFLGLHAAAHDAIGIIHERGPMRHEQAKRGLFPAHGPGGAWSRPGRIARIGG